MRVSWLPRYRRRLGRLARRIPPLWAIAWAIYRACVRAHRDVSALVPRKKHPEILSDFRMGPRPTFSGITSQPCDAAQCLDPTFLAWCSEMRSPPRFHRKQWEYAYILQALAEHGMLRPGRRGLGFACGREPVVAILAKKGCRIVATDLSPEEVRGRGWDETGQYAGSRDGLNETGLCPHDVFARAVDFRFVDMTRVPKDLAGFDFTWSSCAIEHLGSLRAGLDFVLRSLQCVRPGGVAIHTTELNLSSDEGTWLDGGCALYGKRDILAFVEECAARQIEVMAPLWNCCSRTVDEFVDTEPFRTSPHLKLRLGPYIATSFGLVLRRPVLT